MAVEIVRRETIKPSSPTPPHLKSFKLSSLDQIAPLIYIQLVLFYPNNNNNNDVIITSDQIVKHLKKSLSEALTRFYPLAGRLANNTAIECDDGEGALFVEAKFNGFLSTFLDKPNEEVLERFLPAKAASPEAVTGPLLLVQVTFFDCRGLAIGVCLSHKLGDAATLSLFMKTWARSVAADVPAPDFNAAFHFPPRDSSFSLPAMKLKLKMKDYVSKRYVFDKLNIAALKAKVASEGIEQPTRVEVVSALVWKCAIKASRLNSESSNSTLHNYSVFSPIVNVRKRVEPPFADNLVGNLVGYFGALVYYKEQEPELHDLVAKLREGIEEYGENQAKRFKGDEALKVISKWYRNIEDIIGREDVKPTLLCSSWCNFDFHEIDFGWGKPIWATRPCSPMENTVMLNDTRDRDGVEVCLTLSKENMASLDRELLTSASPA